MSHKDEMKEASRKAKEDEAKREIQEMAAVIRKLNEEELPCFIMNVLRRKINVELILMEE